MVDNVHSNMSANDLSKSFLEELEDTLSKYDNKKDVSRGLAVGLRFTTALLGAGITVLLGWKQGGKAVEFFTNIALMFGAAISVMNLIDSFFSFSSRWTLYKNICTQLIFLQKDFEDESNLDESKCNAYKTRLRTIVMEVRQGELEMHKKRSEGQPQTQKLL